MPDALAQELAVRRPRAVGVHFMGLFGNGRSDDRRRRMLTDEVISGAARVAGKTPTETPAKTPASSSKIRYKEAARMQRHARLNDYVPRSYAGLALWFALGASLIGGLEAAYFYAPEILAFTADGRMTAIDLAAKGSLASGLASLLLLSAAAVAYVVYGTRKQRADDYHARYRVWLSTAFCWFAMSVDEASSVREGFQSVMTKVAGAPGFADASVYWIGAYALVLGIVGLRLALDLKECRFAMTLLAAAAACWIGSVVAKLGYIPLETPTYDVMLAVGLKLAGHLLLLTSMLAHARYVVLDADGDLTKSAKSKKSKEKATESESQPSLMSWLRKAKVDPPHGTPAPAGKTSDLEPAGKSGRVPSSAFKPVAAVKKVQADFAEEDDDDRRDNRKMNKGERKALRRQKEMERRYGMEDE